MVGNAFISHIESEAKNFAMQIHKKLRQKEIGMTVFSSPNNIHHGDNITKTILESIIDTDLLIFLITSGINSKPWLKWEYGFCKERNIIIFEILFPDAKDILKQVSYIEEDRSRIRLEEYDSDILIGKVALNYFKKKIELTDLVEKKNNITITLQTDKLNCRLTRTAELSGNIKHNKDQNPITYSNVYLHILDTDPKNPPKSSRLGKLTLKSNGCFNCIFDLPKYVDMNKSQTMYYEIRVNNKSKLFPINICPQNMNNVDNTDTSSNGISTNTSSSKTTSDSSSGSNIDKIRQKINTISDGTVKSIPKQIKGKEIERNVEISGIISKLNHENRIIISGDKGVGKSVLLCQLYQKLKESYQNVLFIRCDYFLGIDSIEALENLLDENIQFSNIVNNLPDDSEIIILFDSLDAISRNTKTIGIFKQFLTILWGTNKIKTICSVRSYDYEYSPLISTTDWGVLNIVNELDDDLLEKILHRLGNPNIPNSLKKILKNPLRLNLLSMILVKKPDADFSNITNEIELYNEHWKEYIEKQREPSKTTMILFDISKKMMISQKILIPSAMLEDSENLFDICSRDIIKISNGQVQFFHHAYLDYVLSKYILQNYSDVTQFLKENQYNVFLRPTLGFTLSLLYNIDKIKYLKNILNLCESELKYYWKITALKSLSKVTNFEINEIEKIGVLLTKEPILQRHFLLEVTKSRNPFWHEMWARLFMKEWYSKENGNGKVLVDYIASLEQYSEYHEQMFSLIRSLVEKGEYPMVKYSGIKATAKIISNEKAAWYKKLSQNEESKIRSGVLSCLLDLLDTEPDSVPKIFSNIFTYKETSRERTQMMSYGTFELTSNKNQDNSHVIWESGELFPQLLEKNPKKMIESTILIFEKLKKKYLTSEETDIVEDLNYIWYNEYNSLNIYDENKLIYSVQKYLDELSKEDILEFIPLLKTTQLAIFHKLLLKILLKNPKQFKDEIYECISKQIVLKILSLEPEVRMAIRKTSKLLSESQNKKLIQNIMELTFLQTISDEKHLRITNKKKAKFLIEFEKHLLSNESINILEQFPEIELKHSRPVSITTSITEVTKQPPKLASEEIIEQHIGKTLEDNERIDLLRSIIDYLGKKTNELDDSKLLKIHNYLLRFKNHVDPEKDIEDDDASFMIEYDTVRGLVARGIIRLFYHTKNNTLKEIINVLSRDKINIVRADVAHELSYLFSIDYTLTLDIATRYSKESDTRVQFYLNKIINYLLNDHSKDALIIIQNILNLSNEKNQDIGKNLVSPILYLALEKNNKLARELLFKILENKKYPTEIQQSIPFILKEQYLFNPNTQNDALDIFLKLLDADDSYVRDESSFFLLCSIEKNNIDNFKNLINKIRIHLDKIASEIEKQNLYPKIIENLIRFLEKFWDIIPEKTLSYLEKISKNNNYSPYQPIFAHGTITILNGLFQLPSLSATDRNRCLEILDVFAMAGWPEALELLSVMERPD